MTQHNVFVRRFDDMAIIITVTDWNDFSILNKHIDMEHKGGDLLLGGITKPPDIYLGHNPHIMLDVHGQVEDISDLTKGTGLASILTGSSPIGPIWSFKKIDDPLGFMKR